MNRRSENSECSLQDVLFASMAEAVNAGEQAVVDSLCLYLSLLGGSTEDGDIAGLGRAIVLQNGYSDCGRQMLAEQQGIWEPLLKQLARDCERGKVWAAGIEDGEGFEDEQRVFDLTQAALLHYAAAGD